MEEERREHVTKMKKMEMEMEQVFEMKVKEKVQKLKDSEAEVKHTHTHTHTHTNIHEAVHALLKLLISVWVPSSYTDVFNQFEVWANFVCVCVIAVWKLMFCFQVSSFVPVFFVCLFIYTINKGLCLCLTVTPDVENFYLF